MTGHQGQSVWPPEGSLLESFTILDEAVAEHDPALAFAFFSGGHDSLTAVSVAQDWAQARDRWLPVIHVNTGTGIKETRQFVIDTAQEHDWPLIEMHPPKSYERICLQFGFPGPGFHALPYSMLKERCFRNLRRLAPEDRKVLFITGVRQEESVRRTEHVERVQVAGRTVWAAPIWDWTKADCNHFIADRGLARNPVVDFLHMSGECLCGAFARKVELAEIGEWFPERAAEIRALEDRVEAAGQHACRWGKRPPKVNAEQMRAYLTPSDGSFPMLCAGCGRDEEEPA